jgi:hypothetical protein
MKRLMKTSIPGYRPRPVHVRVHESGHLLNSPSIVQYVPEIDCYEWPGSRIEYMVKDLWNEFSKYNILDDELDPRLESERVQPVESLNSTTEVYLACMINVLRPVCNMMSKYMGCSIQLLTDTLVSPLSSIRTNAMFVSDIGRQMEPLLSINFKPPGSLLPAFNAFVTKSKNNSKVECWNTWMKEAAQTACLQRLPFCILTDYTHWGFIQVMTCNTRSRTLACWVSVREFSDRGATIAEMVAALLNVRFTADNKINNETLAFRTAEIGYQIKGCIAAKKAGYREAALKLHKRVQFHDVFGTDYFNGLVNIHQYPDKDVEKAFRRVADVNRDGGLLLDYLLNDFVPTTEYELPLGSKPDSCSQCRIISTPRIPVKCFEKVYNYDRFPIEPLYWKLETPVVDSNLLELANRAHNHLYREIKAYHKLSILQGSTIPYFYAVILSDPYGFHDRRYAGILLEYVPSTAPLSEWINNFQLHNTPNLTRQQALSRVASNLKKAVYQIHDLGVAHCNLTPENVLVRLPDLSVIIVGFTRAQPDTRHGPLIQNDKRAIRSIFSRSNQFRNNLS